MRGLNPRYVRGGSEVKVRVFEKSTLAGFSVGSGGQGQQPAMSSPLVRPAERPLQTHTGSSHLRTAPSKPVAGLYTPTVSLWR